MLWARFINCLFKEAKPFLLVRGDQQHARVSHQYALKLLDQEKGDNKIVEPAVILHDVGWSCLKPQQITIAYGVKARSRAAQKLNRMHEIQGAEIARRILKALEYDAAATDRIGRIIARHDSGKKIACAEEGMVKDADKLWRFSQIGFWMEVKRQQIEPKDLHFHLNQHRRAWFFSATARKLAQAELRQREQEMASKIRLRQSRD